MRRQDIDTSHYEEYLSFVQKTLVNAGRDQGRRHPFRSRTKHTRRVLKWAERISEGRDDVDLNVLFLSVIFHDVGYIEEDLGLHQIVGAEIFRKYATEQKLDSSLIDKVSENILIHPDKWKLKNPEMLTIEQILLMEADLLDEEGALGICWDGIATGYEEGRSYDKAYLRIIDQWIGKLENNPMATEISRKYWEDKQIYVRDFIQQLKFDLEEWNE